ncbi:unnamed protein product, partial [Rotaria socialis]
FGNQGCNGGLVNAAFQYIKANKGVDTEASYPYEAMKGKCRFNRSTVGATDRGFVNIEKGNETALQIAVATVGPIGVAVDDLHDSFFFYSSGVYDEPACSTKEWSHTMTIVGYDSDNPFIIKGKSRLRGANTHGLVNIKDNGQSYVGYCLFETNVVSAYQALREVQYMVKDKENERQT